MLLLGVLAAQAEAAPAAAGDYDLLETEILTGTQASLSLTGLSTYSADYQHLQIRMVTRVNAADAAELLFLQMNSDTGSNYSDHFLRGEPPSVLSGGRSSQTSARFLRTAAGNNSAGIFSAQILDFYDAFETTKYKTFRVFSGHKGDAAGTTEEVSISSGLWQSTSAISSLEITAQAGSFVSGTRFSLYGLKAA